MFKPPRKLAIAEACLSCELTDGRETSRFDDRSRDPRNDVDRLRTTHAVYQPALRGVDALRKIFSLHEVVAKMVGTSSDEALSFDTLIGKLACRDAKQRVKPTRLKVDGEDFQGARKVEPSTGTTLGPHYRQLRSGTGRPAIA
ncbi:hypothetical protein ATE62_05045 [Sphingopyxis sp. HIX]|nr:hypothetical protein ATE62_05045 [Sphingopyxis sp. HIX]KTE85400.1 hypothetical protein ATE72_03910 [Sphingopyxis sp. HXXIV]